MLAKKLLVPILLVLSLFVQSPVFAQNSADIKRDQIVHFFEYQSPEVIERFYNLLNVLFIVGDYYVDEKSLEELIDLAMKGAVSGLDPHSHLLLGEEASEALKTMSREDNYVGVGMQIQSISNNTVVMGVFDNSPAMTVGIEPGDIITRVNGQDIWGLSTDEVARLIMGPEGTTVQLEIKSRSYQQPRILEITREKVEVISVIYRDNLFDDIGYIKVSAFNEETPDRFHEALRSLSDKRGLIIDLRDNPGGLLNVVVKMVGQMVGPGQLVITEKGRITYPDVKTGDEDEKVLSSNTERIVIIVNNFSASASEIMAGSLQYYNVADIVGVRTFGKALVQRYGDIDDDPNDTTMYLGITVARYYLPDGRDISATGVVPDFEVEQSEGFRRYDYRTQNDLQFQKAVELIRGENDQDIESEKVDKKWYRFFQFWKIF
jgi:carboxyl-terminal processing protease